MPANKIKKASYNWWTRALWKKFHIPTKPFGLIIPKGITISGRTFEECEHLVSLTISANAIIGEHTFKQCKNLTSITMPANATIGDYAFFWCDQLTDVTIPENAHIGNSAFSGCDDLTTITIRQGASIGSYAFSGCNRAANLTIEESVTLGRSAFQGCHRLTHVIIPDKTTIADYTFTNCGGLIEATFLAAINIGSFAFSDCPHLVHAIIPARSTIGHGAFSDCIGLTSATLSEGVTIGKQAFYRCKSLTQLTLSRNITIGRLAFFACTSLKTLTIGENAAIQRSAFCYCSELTEVTIHKGITVEPDADPFSGCMKLRAIYVANQSELERIRSILPDHQKPLVQIKSRTPYTQYKSRIHNSLFNASDCNSIHADSATRHLNKRPVKTYLRLLELTIANGCRIPTKPGSINWLRHNQAGKTVLNAIQSCSDDNETRKVLREAIQAQLNPQQRFGSQQLCHPHHELPKTAPDNSPLMPKDAPLLVYAPSGIDADTERLWDDFFRLALWATHEAKLADLKNKFKTLIRKPGTRRYPYTTWSTSGLSAIVNALARLRYLVTSHPNPAARLSKEKDALTQLSYCYTGVLAGLNALCAAINTDLVPRIKQLANQAAQAYIRQYGGVTHSGNEAHLPLQLAYLHMGLPVRIKGQIEDRFHPTISDQHLKNIAEFAMEHCNAEQLAAGVDPICLENGVAYQLHDNDLSFQISQLAEHGLLASLRDDFPIPSDKGNLDEGTHNTVALICLLTNKTTQECYDMYVDVAVNLNEITITPKQAKINRLRNWVQQQRITTIEKQPGIASKNDINTVIKDIQIFLTTPGEIPYTNEQMDFWDEVLSAVDGMALVRQAIETMNNPTLIAAKALLFRSGTSTNLYQRFASNPVYTDFLLGSPDQPSPLSSAMDQLSALIADSDDTCKKEAHIHLEQCLFQAGGLHFALRYMLEQDTRFAATANMIKTYLDNKSSQLHHDSLPGVLADIAKHGDNSEKSIAKSFLMQRFSIHCELKQHELAMSYIDTIIDINPDTLVFSINDLIQWFKQSKHSISVLSNGLWSLIRSDEDWSKFENTVKNLIDKDLKDNVICAVRSLHPDLQNFLQHSPAAAFATSSLFESNPNRVQVFAGAGAGAGASEHKQGDTTHAYADPGL